VLAEMLVSVDVSSFPKELPGDRTFELFLSG